MGEKTSGGGGGGGAATPASPTATAVASPDAARAVGAAMKKRKAVRIVLCQPSPVFTDRKFAIEVQLRLTEECRLVDIAAHVEGRCRASFDGHDNMQTLATVPIDMRPLYSNLHKALSKPKDPSEQIPYVLPPGLHRVLCPITLPANLPGTFKARHGAIAYRASVKVKVKTWPRNEEISLEGEKSIDVIGCAALDAQPRYDEPIVVDQHFTKSFLCFNRLDLKVNAELERSAYKTGEYVLVSGKVENGGNSTSIKSVNLELRQLTQYLNGTTKRLDNRLISSLSCGSCAVDNTLTLHNSIQIPANVYPSLINQTSAVQVFYEIHITGNDKFRVEIPLYVGNRDTAQSKPRPRPTSTTSSSIYSNYSGTYSTTDGSHDSFPSSPGSGYARVHPHPSFAPIYGMRQMPPFSLFPPPPPRYEFHDRNYKPFIKIEEIE